MTDAIRDDDYKRLAAFRYELRRFLHFSTQAAAAAGLTAQQQQAMLAIRGAPEACMLVGALADRLMLRPHSATGLVDRLEKLGLVVRDTARGDRRRVAVRLSPRGEEILASLSAAHRDELRRIRPVLGDLISGL